MKLTSIDNPLFKTLEAREMKQVLGGVSEPTQTGPSPMMTTSKSTGQTSVDGTNPGSPNDNPDN